MEPTLTIGEVALRSGLRPSAIRYYEAQGLLPSPARRSGRRIYTASVIRRLAVIQLAQVAGFALTEVVSLLADLDAGAAAPIWRRRASAKALEVDTQIDRLVQRKEVLRKLGACRCATLDECARAFIEARAQQPHRRRLQLAPRGTLERTRG